MKEDYIEMLEDYLKLELGDEQVLGLNSFAVNNILNIIKSSDKEIERLHSIIKEVREYIEDYRNGTNFKKETLPILEILDKENRE